MYFKGILSLRAERGGWEVTQDRAEAPNQTDSTSQAGCVGKSCFLIGSSLSVSNGDDNSLKSLTGLL